MLIMTQIKWAIKQDKLWYYCFMLKELSKQIQEEFPGIFKEIYKKYIENGGFNNAPVDSQLTKELLDFVVSAGKRVRPTFLFVGGLGEDGFCVPKKDDPFWYFAAGIELVHAGMLIHDDIIDKEENRRGVQCIHKKIGMERAIVLGDIAWSMGYDIMLQANMNAEQKMQIIHQFLSAAFTTGLGQDNDILFRDKKDFLRDEIENLYAMKTAAYSFSAPLIMGALLQEREERTESFRKIGNLFGILYQLVDDIEDQEKEESILLQINIDRDAWMAEVIELLNQEIEKSPASSKTKDALKEGITLICD